MGYMTINNRRVAFTDEKNVLSVIRKSGIDLPTFCYHSELSTYGACRMCVVEDDRGKIFASCSEVPRDGMVIYTHTPRLQHHRKMILELLLSSHCRDCTTCTENGVCTLQTLSRQLGIDEVRFENHKPILPLDESSECIVRDPNKCILCGDCVRTCEEIQGLGILDFAFRGSKMQVMPAFDRAMSQTDCVGCGQCRVVCPTGAISIKQDIAPVWTALADKDTCVIAQIAPAVRVAIGDKFGIPKGENTLGRLVAALRMIGFDEIYDTNFGADLTVMEESKELVERLESGENLPLFTSCCPAWVKFLEDNYPELKDHLSSAKSPQQIGGAIFKTYGAQLEGREGKDIYSVSVMPCTCKEFESERPEMKDSGFRDEDAAITTRDLAWLIKDMGIDWEALDEQEFDQPLGLYTGAGTIFGVTGGVMEAAIRTGYELVTGQPIPDLEVTAVRGTEGFRTSVIKVGDLDLKVGVVTGLKNVVPVLEAVKNGTLDLHFIEVMTCPEGCVSGGGQPKLLMDTDREEAYAARRAATFAHDRELAYRKSHENPAIKKIYEEFLEEPNSHIAHHLLHTTYCNK